VRTPSFNGDFQKLGMRAQRRIDLNQNDLDCEAGGIMRPAR
jgi:hypothetical protein